MKNLSKKREITRVINIGSIVILFIVFCCSCTSHSSLKNPIENMSGEIDGFEWGNYKIIGSTNSWGIQSISGEILLDTIYKRAWVQRIGTTNEVAFRYTTRDNRIGIIYRSKTPLIEVDSTYDYIRYINSTEYFAFRLKDSVHYASGKEGIIDKNNKVIFSNKYDRVSYDGKKLFFLKHPEDNKYYTYNLKGEKIKNKGYRYIYSGKGITYAALGQESKPWKPTKDKYILDDEGNEISSFACRYIKIIQCPQNKNKDVKYLKMMNDYRVDCFLMVKNQLNRIDCSEVCEL